jgi:hypothetical protein
MMTSGEMPVGLMPGSGWIGKVYSVETCAEGQRVSIHAGTAKGYRVYKRKRYIIDRSKSPTT